MASLSALCKGWALLSDSFHPPSIVRPFKSITADSNGNFDLGPIPSGHYTLKIHEPTWNNSDYFQVEIKSVPTPAASVLIDISPIRPDRTGGQKFIVKTK